MSKRSDVIAATYAIWANRWAGSIEPDPRYSVDGDSQYPEGVEALSAPAQMQDELVRMIAEALEAAGLPAEWQPPGIVAEADGGA